MIAPSKPLGCFFFLAVMYVLAGQKMEIAYTYFGMAVRAVAANGIHKNFSLNIHFASRMAESRKRLFGVIAL